MDAGGVFAILFAILFLIVSILYARKLAPSGTMPVPSIEAKDVSNFIEMLILYMPNTFFVYSFIADIINNEYHYSIASITALCGMIINKGLGHVICWIMSKISYFKSSIPTIDALEVPMFTGTSQSGGGLNVCSLPGFEWLESKIAPQGIVMSMTVLWYIMIEMWDTGQGSNTIGVGVATLLTFALQTSLLWFNGCLESSLFKNWSALTALVMGIIFAGTSYGVQKLLAQHLGVGTVGNSPKPFNFKCPKGYIYNRLKNKCEPMNEKIITVGDEAGQSQPVDDNDQFVCEAYKDGELVTSTIVE